MTFHRGSAPGQFVAHTSGPDSLTPGEIEPGDTSRSASLKTVDLRELSTVNLPPAPRSTTQFVDTSVSEGTRSNLLDPFYRSGPLIGQRRTRFVYQPAVTEGGRNWASNFDHDAATSEEVTIFLNGFTYGKKGFMDSVAALSNAYGREVVVIVNDQERSIAGDILNATAGFLSAGSGNWAENTAVTALNREILIAHAQGKRVRLVPYSQGSIIAGNALTLLRKQMGEREWSKLKLEVETYGAAYHDFPTGKPAIEYRLSHDQVSRGTTWLADAKRGVRNGYNRATATASSRWSGLKHWWNGTNPEPSLSLPTKQVARVVYLKSDRKNHHWLQTYMSLQPEFFLEARRNDRGKLNSTRVARDLVTSVQKGRYADWVHDQLLAKLAGNRTVAVTMLAAADNKRQIGKYRIPEAIYQTLQRTTR